MALLRRREPARLEAVDLAARTAHLATRIQADPDWQRGAAWGAPMSGHPEATVGEHIEEVLANVAEEPPGLRDQLRVIALVHDTMKHRVRWYRPDHARLAARFAARYIDDPGLLKVIRRHDDAYRAWRFGQRWRLWPVARWRARRLIADLGDQLDLYRSFYRCDNETGDKSGEPREWFEGLVASR
jgi:hypothetical protein